MMTFELTFDFYYDENTMHIPEVVLESTTLSQAAKNVYVYILYLTSESVENIYETMQQLEAVSSDLVAGLEELIHVGLLKQGQTKQLPSHYLVFKTMKEPEQGM